MRNGGAGIGVTPELKIRVNHVIHGVQDAADRVLLPGFGNRSLVGIDRLHPIAHAREDMRRHVQRVRGVRRDIRIAQCRRQPFLRERREIVGVNEIVGHARMVRMLGKLRFENCSRLQRPGIGLVGRRLTCGEIERVEYLRFIVVGITRREPLERVGQRPDARALRPLGETVVIGGDRFDVIALALRLGANGAAAIDLLCARRACSGSRPDAERVAYQEGRDSPGGDGATRIAVERLAERSSRPTRNRTNAKGDAALKALLRLRRAGIGEGDGAELCRRLRRPRGPGRPVIASRPRTWK